MATAGEFEPYIHYVRFPRFKNLAAGTKIEFTHPITAIVGSNGMNKTSILRALYGVPKGMSTGTYWFSTALDAIVGERATCIHGRKQGAQIVEVLKQRSAANKTPDYWEPSRPVRAYGMEEMPAMKYGEEPIEGRSRTRWDPISKPVVYIESCDRVSAFDRFFHYGGSSIEKEARKETIKRRSPVLKYAIETAQRKLVYYGKSRIRSNYLLNEAVVSTISEILGRKYSKIQWIDHSLYGGEGATAHLHRTDLSYSEAFAGSGEFAVCQIVRLVHEAQPRSLVLIDEPEMFLHPHAQTRLMNFLAEITKTRKHQVVVSTHAPAIIRDLPSAAIKVLAVSPTDENEIYLVAQEAEPDTAFIHIGEPVQSRVQVYVEDRLSKYLVRRSFNDDVALNAKLVVTPIPGGASAMWNFAVMCSIAKRDDVRFVFDGDNRPKHWPPQLAKTIADDQIDEAVKAITGISIRFPVDGGASGGDDEQRKKIQREFVEWIRRNVEFLPGMTPEEFLLVEANEAPINGEDPKKIFLEKAKERVGDTEVDSGTILAIQREYIGQLPTTHSALAKIKKFLASNAGLSS